MAQHTAEWFLENLEGVEGSSGQYSAWCPCHPDIGTSVKGLSVTVTASGKVLIKCHSCGADITAVKNALEDDDPYGMQDADFTVNVHKRRNGKRVDSQEDVQEPKGSTRTRKKGLDWWADRTGIPVETWRDLGVEVFESGVAFTFDGMEIAKVRRPPKEWAWVGSGERPPLWPVPEDELPEEIAITEGESDCGTMRHVGYHAFAITSGAGKSRENKRYLSEAHFEGLKARGAQRVLLCGDADASGAQMMAMMADTATAVGLQVSVLRLDLVLDPFSGLNDLNGMWKEAGPKKFGELLKRAVQEISAATPVVTLSEILVVAEEQVDWLVPNLIAPSDKVLISGPQKSYKTWVALELMRTMLTGQPFLMRKVEWTPERLIRKAMFVQEEGSRQLWARRIRKLQLPEDAGALFWHRRGFKFTDPEKVAQLIDTCRREEVEVLFLDPMQRMIPGVDENDSSGTGVVWDEVQRLQEACPNLVVCILHHANKSERLTWESVRGSSRHAGEVDLGLFLEKHPVEDHTVRVAVDGRDIPQYLGTGESFEAHVKMSTDAEEEKGSYYFVIDGTEVKANIRNTGQLKGKKNRNEVLQAIREGADTRTKIMRATDLSDVTVREHLVDLMDEDLIVETDNGTGKARTYTEKEDV